jgi:hypothetical protein
MEDRVRAFYRVYNPSRLHRVQRILNHFNGREDELIQQLVAKYGPEPSPGSSPAPDRTRVGTTGTMEDILALVATVHRMYGPGGPDSFRGATQYEARYVDGEWYAVAKGHSYDDTAFVYQVKWNRDQGAFYFRNMATRQKVSELPDVERAARPAARGTASLTEDRVRAFYSVYNPSRLNRVSRILSHFAGREDELIRQLITKYGPEPSDEPSPAPNHAAAPAAAGSSATLSSSGANPNGIPQPELQHGGAAAGSAIELGSPD